MVAFLEKGEYNVDFHHMVDFIEVSSLSPKSTGFNEFSSNIATALVCLATNRTYNLSKMIFDGLVKNVNKKISKFLMYPRDDASINGRSIDEREAATERISDDSEEMATILTLMDAATVLASRVIDVPTGSGSIPTASNPVEVDVPTGSDVV
nr:synaptobrevin, longin-like domain protein [Tanacetum cinerariifolium]